jgi:hypothetical protein
MRFVSGLILSVSALAGFLAAVPARAEDAPATPAAPPASDAPAAAPACEIPDYFLAGDRVLPKVADAIKAGGPLNILVIGSRSSTIGASVNAQDAAYPGQMQAALKQKLPKIEVNLSVEIQPKKTAEEMTPDLAKLLETKKPTLVVWQTGTVDAMRSVDPDDFRTAVDEGVVALQNGGVDTVLVNLQYSPRTESMISASAYLDDMRVVAQEHDVPLFDRFGLMQKWSDDGEFDLFAPVHGAELAKKVHGCLGRALSQFILDAAHPKPVQGN